MDRWVDSSLLYISGDADHHYALLDLSLARINISDYLSSPIIIPGSYCLSFWYQISGSFHHFNVTLHTAPRPRLIWKLSDQTKGRWIQVTVDIKCINPFRVSMTILQCFVLFKGFVESDQTQLKFVVNKSSCY